MKITLAKIKEHHPCPNGWKKILAAQGPDLDREWPLVEAFKSNGLDDVLWALRCLPEHSRLWRKYSVWCVKQVEQLLTDQRSKDALEVAWRYSNGLATDAELAAARAAASAAAWASAKAAAKAAAEAATYAACDAAGSAARTAARAAWVSANDAARAAQKEKLIQILTDGEWEEGDE